MPKEFTDANYQVVEVSFGETLLWRNIKKALSNCAGNGEYLHWQGRSNKNCNNINSPNGTFCALLIRRFYTSDFETKTDKQLSTQVRCQKGHTVASQRSAKSCGLVEAHLDKHQLLGG